MRAFVAQACNETEEDRIVLIVDLARYRFPEPAAATVAATNSPSVARICRISTLVEFRPPTIPLGRAVGERTPELNNLIELFS